MNFFPVKETGKKFIRNSRYFLLLQAKFGTSGKARQHNGQKKEEKQRYIKHYIEN
jgi:hypothetical protein